VSTPFVLHRRAVTSAGRNIPPVTNTVGDKRVIDPVWRVVVALPVFR
jgi:hypothetical protein